MAVPGDAGRCQEAVYTRCLPCSCCSHRRWPIVCSPPDTQMYQKICYHGLKNMHRVSKYALYQENFLKIKNKIKTGPLHTGYDLFMILQMPLWQEDERTQQNSKETICSLPLFHLCFRKTDIVWSVYCSHCPISSSLSKAVLTPTALSCSYHILVYHK